MLGTLDPHSSFFDPREYAQMRERQEGRYYGLGITIQAVDGDITAVRVFEGSPAYKKGVRRGDVSPKIEGEAAKGWTTRAGACSKLRGPKGTTVHIDIRRRGYEQLIPLRRDARRGHIPTVPACSWSTRRPATSSCSDFGENTDHDLKHALHELSVEGDEAAAARHPRQSGRAARSGHQGLERIPARGQDDRLHARPRSEFGSGLPRDRRQRVHGHSDRR